jgi:spore coat polysaccharide biosynthesis protein SpsF
MTSRTVAVVAARMGSERLPGKSMAMLAGKPAFAHLAERLKRSRLLDDIVLATTHLPEDEPLRACAASLEVPFFAGSPSDVLGRTLKAARSVAAEVIVQVTGDCPLIDPQIVDRVIQTYRAERPDYAANVIPSTYPNGMDVEVFATSLLSEVDGITTDAVDREHVSLYIYEHPDRYRLINVAAPAHLSRPQLRLCIDTEQDYEVVRAIYQALYPIRPDFHLDDILGFLDAHPAIAALNASVEQKPARP